MFEVELGLIVAIHPHLWQKSCVHRLSNVHWLPQAPTQGNVADTGLSVTWCCCMLQVT